MNDPKQIVRDGYDEIGGSYRPWADASDTETRAWFLSEVLARVPAGADVLELGCGPGVDGRLLAEGRTYTGVDISPAMVELARGNVPAGQFIARDLATLDLPESSFDAVVSLYVTGHLPADEHAPLVRRAWRWLRSGGVFCSSFPLGAGEDVEGDFIGVPMFFGGIGPDATKEALAEAGFAIELERGLTDPMALQGGFLWAIARKPA